MNRVEMATAPRLPNNLTTMFRGYEEKGEMSQAAPVALPPAYKNSSIKVNMGANNVERLIESATRATIKPSPAKANKPNKASKSQNSIMGRNAKVGGKSRRHRKSGKASRRRLTRRLTGRRR